jgi:hypothetical protein
MRRLKLLSPILILAAIVMIMSMLPIFLPRSHAAEGGTSNYVPGLYGDFAVAVASAPGFLMRHDLYFYTADAEKQRFVQGEQIRADLDLDTGMYLLNVFMVLDTEILGGQYAFGANLPIIYGSLSGNFVVGPEAIPFDDNGITIGDLGIIPISLNWNSGNFHFNLYESIIVPIGSYDKSRLINGSLNYWSFDTDFAATYFHPEKGHEVSAVLGYIYNTENSDTSYHTGQECHLDYMLNQFLSETFAVGLQGFYYRQITGDKGSGALLGDFRGEAWGIGPAVMWATKVKNIDLYINLKWFHEFNVENRLEGDHLYVSATMDF